MLSQWENVQMFRIFAQKPFEIGSSNFQGVCVGSVPTTKQGFVHLQMLQVRAICNCKSQNFQVILRIDADIRFSFYSDMLWPLARQPTYVKHRTYRCKEILQHASTVTSHVKSMGIRMAIAKKLAGISI